MATDANGNPVPILDPRLAAILNQAIPMSAVAWPQSVSRSKDAVVIPPPAAPPVTDADTNSANVTDSNPPIAYQDPSAFASRGAVGEATGYAGRPAPSIPTTAPIEPNPASVADVSNIGAAAATNPPLGPVLQRNRTFMQPPGNYQPAPSYMQASTDPNTGLPTAAGPQTKLGKLLSILRGAGIGAAVGSTQPTFGRGLLAANQFEQQQAQENMARQQGALTLAQARQNLAFYPYLQRLGMLKTQQEILKSQAETGKASAEAGGQDYLNTLHEAQAAAARFKEVNGVLYDVSGATPQPVQGAAGQFVPADADMAGVAQVAVGTPLPVSTAQKLKSMANEGKSFTQADGHVWLTDKSSGTKLKDMGAASNVVSFNLQNAGAAGSPGQPSQLAQAIANGTMPWNQAVSARTPLSVKQQILAEVKSINPNFNSGDFTVEQDVRKAFTSGTPAQQLWAIDTARQHMGTFKELAQALGNGNWLLANKLGQAFGTEFGSDRATNFQIARAAFAGEVGKAFAGANVAEGDRRELLDKVNQASSPKQLIGYANTADELLAGKQTALRHGFEASKTGQPDFGTGGAGGGGMTPKRVGEPFMQGGQKWIADEVDQNGKPTKAHPAQ